LYGVLGETSGNPSVVQSNDKGKTWNSAGWSFSKPYQVAVAPSNAKSIVVVSGSSPTSANTVNYTTDGGSTWHLSGGLPATAPASPIFFPVHRFYAAFDPLNASIVLVADHDPATNNVLIYKSTDGGAHFLPAQTFAQPKTQRPWPISNTSGNPPASSKKDESAGYYYAIRFYGNRPAATRPMLCLPRASARLFPATMGPRGREWTRLRLPMILLARAGARDTST
jgi:hypothetical protein